MTSRLLSRDEWPRLVGTELETAIPHLPADTHVIVVENAAGAIVGCWAVLRVVHVEGLWVHPDDRKKGAVGRQLLRAMTDVARGLGATVVMTAAVTDEVRRLIEAVGGQRLPGEHFVIPLKDWSD